jgi:hypothetical protein
VILAAALTLGLSAGASEAFASDTAAQDAVNDAAARTLAVAAPAKDAPPPAPAPSAEHPVPSPAGAEPAERLIPPAAAVTPNESRAEPKAASADRAALSTQAHQPSGRPVDRASAASARDASPKAAAAPPRRTAPHEPPRPVSEPRPETTGPALFAVGRPGAGERDVQHAGRDSNSRAGVQAPDGSRLPLGAAGGGAVASAGSSSNGGGGDHLAVLAWLLVLIAPALGARMVRAAAHGPAPPLRLSLARPG